MNDILNKNNVQLIILNIQSLLIFAQFAPLSLLLYSILSRYGISSGYRDCKYGLIVENLRIIEDVSLVIKYIWLIATYILFIVVVFEWENSFLWTLFIVDL